MFPSLCQTHYFLSRKLQRVQILVSLTRQDEQFRKQGASLFGWKKTVSMMVIFARMGYASIDTLNNNNKKIYEGCQRNQIQKILLYVFFIVDGTVLY